MQARVLATDLQFPEGPAYDSQGNLFFVNCDSGNVHRVTPDGAVAVFANTGGIPAAIAVDAADNLCVTESGLRSVLKISPSGEVSTYVGGFSDGSPFNGTNDLVFAADGTLYVTDPFKTTLDNPVGNVVRITPDGVAERFATGYAFPNGIALTPDGGTLLVAETLHNRLLAFDLAAHGAKPDVFCQLEGGFGPDGMCLAADSTVFVAHYGKGCIAVLGADGTHREDLAIDDENPTNCCFGGADGRSLIITASKTNRVLELPIGVAGLPLHRPVVG